jgi:prepilin-type N-terminal cleavage/methylation domain-containing protein
MILSRLRRRLRQEHGFTLVELTATMAVLGIFFAAASLVLSGAIRNSSQVEDQAVTQNEARAAVDGLAAELRQAYSDSTLAGTPYALQTWTGTTLTFYTPDRQSPMHMRLVSYRLNSNELQRASVTSTNTASTGPWTWSGGSPTLGAYNRMVGTVTNATLFTYWQADGVTAASSLANLAYVRITVTVNPRGSGARTNTYVVNASPRIG